MVHVCSQEVTHVVSLSRRMDQPIDDRRGCIDASPTKNNAAQGHKTNTNQVTSSIRSKPKPVDSLIQYRDLDITWQTYQTDSDGIEQEQSRKDLSCLNTERGAKIGRAHV